MGEDQYKLLIHVAEHAERPVDMLQLLGDYFKETILHCEKISRNIKENKTDE